MSSAAWSNTTFEHVCSKITDGSHYSPPSVLAGMPMASSKDLHLWGIDMSSVRHISTDEFQKLVRSGCQPQIGDVLLAKDGANCLETSCTFRQADDIVLLSSVAILRPGPGLDSDFLHYHLQSAKNFLKSNFVAGSAIPRIVLKDLKRAPIKLPPLAEQKAISSALRALDDKIDLNRRMNQTLEAIAHAIFKSWFVDFDPVRGFNRSAVQSSTGARFPDLLEDSSLGKIPKGWKLGTLEDLLVLQRGFDLPAARRIPGPYPVIAASGFSGTHSEFKVKGPGVTTGRSGILGSVFFVHEDFWPLNTSLWVKEFRGSRPIHAYYTLQSLETGTFNAGSAVPTLNRNHIHNIAAIIPPLEVVEEFENVARPIFALMRNHQRENHTLTQIRDAVLPRLISGEVRVKQVENILGDHG